MTALYFLEALTLHPFMLSHAQSENGHQCPFRPAATYF